MDGRPASGPQRGVDLPVCGLHQVSEGGDLGLQPKAEVPP
jgi:hypothetical protein